MITLALGSFTVLALWDALRRFSARNAVDPEQVEDLDERLRLLEARADLKPRVDALEEKVTAHARTLTKEALRR